MATTKVRGIGVLQNRTVLISSGGSGSATPKKDDQGRTIHEAAAYGYYDGTPATIDSYDTCMAPGAFADVTPDDFRILPFHNQRVPAVGMPVWVNDTRAALMVGFVMDQNDPDAVLLDQKIDDGFIRAVSVGFVPLDGYEMPGGTICFTKCELHELSLVNCPSSKQALISMSREAGLNETEEQDLLKVYADILREPTLNERMRDLGTELLARSADPVDGTNDVATALQLASIADTALDMQQIILSGLLGVENPDDAQDAALDAGDTDDDDDTDSDGDNDRAAELEAAEAARVATRQASTRQAFRLIRRVRP